MFICYILKELDITILLAWIFLTNAEDISKHSLEEPCDCPLSGANVNQSEDLSQNENTNCANQRTTNSDITGKDLSENLTDKSVSSVLNTSEISIRNVDLIGFLLPGLCHMTAEDASRKILLDNDVQSCLSAYFSHCVDTIVQGDMEEAILVGHYMLTYGVYMNWVQYYVEVLLCKLWKYIYVRLRSTSSL